VNAISVDVDLGNPGQLLACCGLLEAADRRWRDQAFVTGHFDGEQFHVDTPGGVSALVDWLRQASVEGVQRKAPKRRRGSNSAPAEYEYSGSGDDAAVLCLPDGRSWRLNSWSGEDFGRTRIKTFAGQMKGPKVTAHLLDWIGQIDVEGPGLLDVAYAAGNAAVFGFNAEKGRSARDIGFSSDALGMSSEEFPAVELFAAIGLQSFRPRQDDRDLVFGAWTQPLPVELARAAAGCAFVPPGLRRFRFRLLGRKERSGVAGAPNDQYKAFTRAEEIFERTGEDDD
jgi:CRISPR-associated protein Csx14